MGTKLLPGKQLKGVKHLTAMFYEKIMHCFLHDLRAIFSTLVYQNPTTPLISPSQIVWDKEFYLGKIRFSDLGVIIFI